MHRLESTLVIQDERPRHLPERRLTVTPCSASVADTPRPLTRGATPRIYPAAFAEMESVLIGFLNAT